MKKLIAISVMLALVAGAAFAQPSVGGNMKISGNLIGGNSDADDVMAGPITFWDVHTNVSWSGDNAGGLMRLHAGGQGDQPLDWTPDIFAFWWWRPIEQLRIQLGKNPDGDWGHAQISGWGFNAEAQGGVAIDKDRELTAWPNDAAAAYARTKGFAPGFNNAGLAISIFPVTGLQINLGIPLSEGTAKDVYLDSYIDLSFRIEDIGTVRLAVDLGDEKDNGDEAPNFFGSFYLMAIDNMGVDIGVGYKTKPETFEIGLGYNFDNGGDFAFKARAGVEIGDDIAFGIGILPSFKIGNPVIYFNAGLGMLIPDQGDNAMDWFVNPYIRVPANVGNFYAGFKLYSLETLHGNTSVSWAIPIGWNVYF